MGVDSVNNLALVVGFISACKRRLSISATPWLSFWSLSKSQQQTTELEESLSRALLGSLDNDTLVAGFEMY